MISQTIMWLCWFTLKMHYDKFHMDLTESIISGLIQNVLIILIMFSKGTDETKHLEQLKRNAHYQYEK